MLELACDTANNSSLSGESCISAWVHVYTAIIALTKLKTLIQSTIAVTPGKAVSILSDVCEQ